MNNNDAFKQALRIHCQTIRKHLSSEEQAVASASVCERIQALSPYQKAKHIAIYHAVHGEIDLSSLRETSHEKKTCYFPIMNVDQTLSFLPVTTDTVFYKNSVGIPEPDVTHELAIMPKQLDIIFLPLVAFDEHGTRLGMGGGYYDRTLAHNHSTLLVGVGYEFQRQAFIEPQRWDVPLAIVITECNTYWSK